MTLAAAGEPSLALLGNVAAVHTIGCLGGCFGPSDLDRPSKDLQGYAKRHYTRDEIQMLCRSVSVDILLVHDAPAGVRLVKHRQGLGWVRRPGSMNSPRACDQEYAFSATTTPGSTPKLAVFAAWGSTR
jgi:hypothetical protein